MINMKRPKHYLEEIDRMYYQFKRDRKSRYDLDWGTWSGAMNREIRERIKWESEKEKVDDKLIAKLTDVQSYWQTVSNLLEACHRGPTLVQMGKKRKLEKQKAKLRKLILKGRL